VHTRHTEGRHREKSEAMRVRDVIREAFETSSPHEKIFAT
jgi:hypothetical protein